MIIAVKYEPKDTVWLIWHNQVMEAKVDYANVHISAGEKKSPSTVAIKYSITLKQTGKELSSMDEGQLHATKQGLVNSLL